MGLVTSKFDCQRDCGWLNQCENTATSLSKRVDATFTKVAYTDNILVSKLIESCFAPP
jgi:hypothetical protein